MAIEASEARRDFRRFAVFAPSVSGSQSTVGVVALCLAVVSLLASAAASAAAPVLYVGHSDDYGVAFKAEGAQLYVMELAGTARCYYTEPHEDLGPTAFSVFPAPTLMRDRGVGLEAEDPTRGGTVYAVVGSDAVSGEFRYDESELSYHCDTGFTAVPFEASRYEPIGSPTTAAPSAGEAGTYYGAEEQIEIYLHAKGQEARGIRGTFVPGCRIGAAREIVARHPLLGGPAEALPGAEGGFERRVVIKGSNRGGARYRETISIAGQVAEEAVTGTYLRVRTIKPQRRQARRCVTGPLPFRALRYLPAGG